MWPAFLRMTETSLITTETSERKKKEKSFSFFFFLSFLNLGGEKKP